MSEELKSTQFRSLAEAPDVSGDLATLAPQEADNPRTLWAKCVAVLNALMPKGTFAEITPNDGVDLGTPTRALYVGGAGDVAVKNDSGATVTFTAVPAGTTLPIVTSCVMSTGTTATGLVAL